MDAQGDINYKKIDTYALNAPTSVTASVEDLATYLSKDAASELETVRSFYTWIIHHISYDYAAYQDGNRRINKSNADVLSRRKAVCFGYASLFKALCEEVNISAVVVTGFSKGSLTAQTTLGEPDHAWSAVKIDAKWHLLDVTWASSLLNESDDFMATLNTDYFLTAPNDFILNHLPIDPMWQLMTCTITADIFQKSSSEIKNFLKTTTNCIDYTDTLMHYENLPYLKQKISSEARAYRFYPTPAMAKEYGNTLMDYMGLLENIAESLKGSEQLDSLLTIQQEMISLCEHATTLTTLYPNQVENCALTRIDYAVALSQKAQNVEPNKQTIIYETMKNQTLKAQASLRKIPPTPFSTFGLTRCQQVLDYLKN